LERLLGLIVNPAGAGNAGRSGAGRASIEEMFDQPATRSQSAEEVETGSPLPKKHGRKGIKKQS
jgi:hypothetical protein